MNAENETRQNEQSEQTQNTNITNEKSSRPIWVIILAALGIIAVLVALGIGIFQLAGKGPENLREIGSNLGNLFRGEERLVLSTGSMTVASNEEVSLNISHRNQDSTLEGVYTVEFECDEGVNINLNNGAAECNEEIALNEIDTNLEFSINSNADRYTDVPITVRFASEDRDLESTLLLTVVNRDIASEVPTTEPETVKEEPASPAKPEETKKEDKTPEYITVERRGSRYSDPNGTPDLKVTVDGVGYIDPQSRDFVYSNRVRTTDRAAVKFTISNVGNKETGNWYFNAILPVEGRSYHHSGKQISLQPGDKMEFTLAFDNIDYRSDGKLYFNADPANEIHEISELNNIVEAQFDIRR